MTPSKRIIWIVVLCFGLGACASGTDASRADLHRAYGHVIRSINNYLGLRRETFEQNPRRFFAEGKASMARIRDAQNEWEDAVAGADLSAEPRNGMPSEGAATQFTDALDQWITAQEEQASLSQQCWASLDRQSCYGSMLAANSARWNAVAARVNVALQRLRSESRG